MHFLPQANGGGGSSEPTGLPLTVMNASQLTGLEPPEETRITVIDQGMTFVVHQGNLRPNPALVGGPDPNQVADGVSFQSEAHPNGSVGTLAGGAATGLPLDVEDAAERLAMAPTANVRVTQLDTGMVFAGNGEGWFYAPLLGYSTDTGDVKAGVGFQSSLHPSGALGTLVVGLPIPVTTVEERNAYPDKVEGMRFIQGSEEWVYSESDWFPAYKHRHGLSPDKVLAGNYFQSRDYPEPFTHVGTLVHDPAMNAAIAYTEIQPPSKFEGVMFAFLGYVIAGDALPPSTITLPAGVTAVPASLITGWLGKWVANNLGSLSGVGLYCQDAPLQNVTGLLSSINNYYVFDGSFYGAEFNFNNNDAEAVSPFNSELASLRSGSNTVNVRYTTPTLAAWGSMTGGVTSYLSDLTSTLGNITEGDDVWAHPDTYRLSVGGVTLYSNPLVNFDNLPALRQIYFNNVVGIASFNFNAVPSAIDKVEIIDCAGNPLGVLTLSNTSVSLVDINGSSFSGLRVVGCSLLHDVNVSETSLDSAAIDQLIADLATCGHYNGNLNISMTAGRTSASDADVTTLTTNGWTLTV